jgi:hypothetical protein
MCVNGQRHATATPPIPGKIPGTHCRWAPKSGLYEWEKFRSHRDLILGSSSPYQVVIPGTPSPVHHLAKTDNYDFPTNVVGICRTACFWNLKQFTFVSLFGDIEGQKSVAKRSGSAAARLLGLWGRIPPGALIFVPCKYCVLSDKVSASGWSLVQRSPTECGVSERDFESSIMSKLNIAFTAANSSSHFDGSFSVPLCRYAIYFDVFFNTYTINDHIIDENKVEMFLHYVALPNKYFSVRLTCFFITRDTFIKFSLRLLKRSCNFQRCGQMNGNALHHLFCHSLYNRYLESILSEFCELFVFSVLF